MVGSLGKIGVSRDASLAAPAEAVQFKSHSVWGVIVIARQQFADAPTLKTLVPRECLSHVDGPLYLRDFRKGFVP